MKRTFTSILTAFLVFVAFLQQASGQTYCNSAFTNVTWEYVTNVTYAGINNTTGGTTGGPVNYLTLGPANVTIGTANTLSVSIMPDGSEYVYAFIDWNHNGTLNDAGEVYTLATSVATAGPFTLAVTPPAGAYIGTTRMRVMLAFANATPDPCMSQTYGEAEDYTVNVQAASGCSTATFPASATTTASPNSLCVSGSSSLSITPITAIPSASGITYQWQSSPTLAGTYTNLGTASATMAYTATISATCYVRCQVLCGTSVVLTSTPSLVTVLNPGVPTVTGASRCGPGSVTLSATPPSGSTINWYSTNTGGNVIGTGNTYTTPYLPTTTTFYAGAAAGTSTATPQIGTGTLTAPSGTNGGPFNNYYRNQTSQFLYTAAEIVAAGGGAGSINSVAFNCLGIPVQSSGNSTLPNYKLYIKTVPSTTTTLTWQAASTFTQVYANATFNPALGWNTLTFTTPFPYNGVDNVVICFCYEQTQPSFSNYATSGLHEYTNVTGRMLSYYNDGVTTACGETGTTSYSYLPNVRLGMTLGCVGTLQPVVATINASPAVTVTNPAVICSNEVGTITATSSPMTNYTNYQWTPNVTDLYTTAAATTPYVTGNAPTVYAKSNVAGSRTYYLFSSGATAAACTHADTISLWVQPQNVTISAIQDTLCAPSGSTTLKLVPNTGYAPNSIQWFTSTNGVNYTLISGATGVTYTTPAISANTYYKAMIKATLDTCQQPVKMLVVSNPQLTSVNDSFNCGPGTVTLTATAGGNSNVRWYASPTANLPIGSGSPWTTPYLNTTTDFYVDAGNGSIQPPAANVIVTGTATTGLTSTFLYYYYTGHKSQYIVTAAQMAAQGYSAGLITSMGIETGNIANPTMNNFTIELGATTSTTLTGWTTTGLQQVYTIGTYTLTANSTNTFTFQNPFYWDGTSNIIVSTCRFNNATNTSLNYYKYRYNSGGGYSMVYYYGNANYCTTPPSTYYTTSYYSPHTIFTLLGGCASARQAVTASIYPKPVVDLGLDINKCVDANEQVVLDAGVQPNGPQFLWDNGSNSQVRAVSASGQYFAKVTNSYTCSNTDTINITLRQNPVVDLGNDTIVCNGVTLTLDPGSDGTQYFWNTGQVTQTIGVTSTGSYNVFVTNNVACTVSDTINVTMQGELPTISGIQISNNGQYTFHFTAVYPQNVIGYDWDFGDSSAHSYSASPTHTYTDGGNYVVVLRLSSTCGFLDDSTSAHIVGINQVIVSNDEMMVYPNPSRGAATILNKGSLKMESIQIYNVLGQVVYRAKADSADKHVIDVNSLASGVYTVEINTDKGTVARKLDIVK